MDTESIRENIIKNDEHCIGALLSLYSCQTADEQLMFHTVHINEMGFNSVDAPFLSDCARFYLEKGFLTPKQIGLVRKNILKYVGQLSKIGYKPAPIKKREAQEQKMEVTLSNNQIVIRFNYNPQLVEKVKTLSGRYYHSDRPPYWTADFTQKNVELLEKFGFDVVQLKKIIREKNQQIEDSINSKLGEVLTGKLRPFQIQGIQFIEKQKGRALIGDEMGLGKTIEAIGWMAIHPELRPAVIVCPATVKQNWEREIRKWFVHPQKIQIIKGQNGKELISNADIYIINYDILDYWKYWLISTEPKILILDESHYIKNPKAKRTMAIMDKYDGMGRNIPHIICLSGTPIINRPIEFFNTIRLINPKLFPSRFRFAQRYCNAKHTGYGWDFSGAANTGELHQILSGTIMIRRMKKDVLQELPEKQRTVLPIEMENGKAKKYFEAERNLISWICKEKGYDAAMRAARAETLVRIEYLKQLALQAKKDQIISWIRDFLDTDEKLVVFCIHRETIDWLCKEFNPISVRIDGSTSQPARQEAIDRFQNDPRIRLFIGNIKVAGTGITLTAASNACFIELGWTPGEHSQAEDRIHRIGQKADSINAWYLLAKDTIEEDIAELLDSKSDVLSSVLDGKPFEEDHMLMKLLKRMIEKEEGKKNEMHNLDIL